VNWRKKNPSFIRESIEILLCYYDFFLIFFFRENTTNFFFKEGRYNLFEEVQDNMAAFNKFVSSFRTVARLLPPLALIVERRVAHSKNNCFMTMEVKILKC
jgi:hypothetical protein